MAQIILSDENCEGQADLLFRELARLGFVDMLGLELKTLSQVGLRKGIDDEAIWRYCQENHCLLLTGNRTTKDGIKSLEYTIQHLVTATSLPVLTISNLKRIAPDPVYRERCAIGLAEIVMELEERHLGVTRLYPPYQFIGGIVTMAHPATGKWPRVQLIFTCHQCNVTVKFSIYYGESTVWANQSAAKLAEWARHEGHESTLHYEFYDGRERLATE